MSLGLASLRGMRDLYPEDMRLREYIFAGWRKVVERYGYEEYMAPMLEPLEMYAAKSGEEIVNEQTYAFSDRGERKVAIRPEMTPSVTRMVAARRQDMPLPIRLYSIANFMRYERPQHGREREFWQLNFDLFGEPGIAGDTEIIHMAHDIVKEFSATDDTFTIKVNDRRLTNYIMSNYLGLNAEQGGRMIKLLDRFDKLPRETFDELAKEIIGSNESAVDKLAAILKVDTIDDLPAEIKSSDALTPVREVLNNLRKLGVNNAKYDIRLMRGFDYYTGVVFEVFDEAPENRRAMFGGGRYDGLVAMFGVETLPVVGAAPGETMFGEFLRAHQLVPELSTNVSVYLLPMTDNLLLEAENYASELRKLGVNVAVDATDRKLDKRIKAGIKHGAKYMVFVGEAEVAAGKLQLKNVATGDQEQLAVSEIAQRVNS